MSLTHNRIVGSSLVGVSLDSRSLTCSSSLLICSWSSLKARFLVLRSWIMSLVFSSKYLLETKYAITNPKAMPATKHQKNPILDSLMLISIVTPFKNFHNSIIKDKE